MIADTRQKIADHRGDPVPLCLVDQLPPDIPADVRATLSKAHRPFSGALLGMVLFFAAGVTVAIIVQKAPDPTYWVTGVLIFGIFGASYMSWRVARKRRLAAAISRCLAWGVCPSCGYPLGSAQVEGDGCRTCPECSAAWRKAQLGGQ